MSPVEIWQDGSLINKMTDNLVTDPPRHQGLIGTDFAAISPLGSDAATLHRNEGDKTLKAGNSVTFENGEVAVVTDK